MTCGYKDALRALSAGEAPGGHVIASTNGNHPRLAQLFEVRVSSANVANRADHSRNDHGVDYRRFDRLARRSSRETCSTSATTCKHAPTRRHCTWVFNVMNPLIGPKDESPRLLCACG
jgi:hypothetical protein